MSTSIADVPTERGRTLSRPARLRARAAGMFDRGLADAEVTMREMLAVAALLSVVAVALFAEHATKGGFYSDDWAYRSGWRLFDKQGGFSAAFNFYWDSSTLSGRPALAAYLALVQAAFGDHQGWYLGWATILAVLLSASFYLFLRTARVPVLHAVVIALLVMVFPASDTTRIWAIISDAQVSMSACLLGGVLALRSFDRSGRAAALLRVGSLALYALSIVHYELAMFAVAASAVVYRARAPWRRALKAGALDVVLVAVLYALIKRHMQTERLGVSATLDHGRNIARQVVELFTSAVMPLDTTKVVALAPAVLVVVAGIVVCRALPADDWARASLRRWLLTLAASVVMVVAAYVIYAPASLIYMPLAPGLMNRTNAFGALPLIVTLYSLGAIAGVLAFRGLPYGKRLAGGFALLLAAIVGASYTVSLTRDLALWDSAYARGQRTLAVIKTNVPEPPNGTLLIAYGQPIEEAPGIPVWEHNWDLDGAVHLMWKNHTISARPAFPGTQIECGRATAGPQNLGAGSVYLPQDERRYGKLLLVDTSTGRFAVPRNRRECLQQAPTFQPGPLYTPADQLP